MTTSKSDEEKLIRQHGTFRAAFYDWYHGDAERAKCTLEQAIGAYCSTFPGRVIPLLVELLQ